jgi:outer membrane usher protein FimD/PapC
LTNLENWKLWLNNLKNGDSSYNNFEKRIADILRSLPAGDNIFYSDIYDLFQFFSITLAT